MGNKSNTNFRKQKNKRRPWEVYLFNKNLNRAVIVLIKHDQNKPKKTKLHLGTISDEGEEKRRETHTTRSPLMIQNVRYY